MFGRLPSSWLPRLFFRLTCFLATLLMGVVVFSPLLDRDAVDAGGWDRLLALFAGDAVVRRTALGSTVGLYVTAWVFFRPPVDAGAGKRPKPPPPADVVSA